MRQQALNKPTNTESQAALKNISKVWRKMITVNNPNRVEKGRLPLIQRNGAYNIL